MREQYIDAAARRRSATPRATGWTFLVAATPGDGAAIRRVADTVGFKYTYIPERAEWAHPAALIFLVVDGRRHPLRLRHRVRSRDDARVDLQGGAAEPATAVGFMNRCYHFDPDANSHARAGVLALRVGAAGFLVLLLSGFGVMHSPSRSSRRSSERRCVMKTVIRSARS